MIVATNPDPFCPSPDGGLPDCAAMLAAVEACTGSRAEAVLGKPGPQMAAEVHARLGVPPGDAAMVGDRILTDVAMSRALRMTSILVLSGATSASDVAESAVQPDYVIDGLGDLLPGASAPASPTTGATVIEFVFMLTHHDRTVDRPLDVYRGIRDCGLRYVGFKDIGATPAELREVCDQAHADGLEVMLEVVSTTRDDELRSIAAAAEIGVDWVLGGTHPRGRARGARRVEGTLLPVPRHDRRPSERAARRDRRDRRERPCDHRAGRRLRT